jgi:hypothetical protein
MLSDQETTMLQQIDTAIAFTVVMLMLSLIVMAIVQVVSALTDLRGRNLASGLQNLLRQIDPNFRDPLHSEAQPANAPQNKPSFLQKLRQGPTIAEHIAEIVVRHPAIAHAGTRAKAVSQADLIRVLRDLCSDRPAATIDAAAKEKLKTLLDTRVPDGPDTVAAAQAVAQRLAAELPGQDAQVKTAVNATFASVSVLERQLGQWFDTIMDRLSDIFTRKTRVITVVISALLVAALQIDSGEILRQIVHSPELRAKLAAMSDSELSQADKLFDNSERAAAALADVKKNHSNDDAKTVAALAQVPSHLTRCVDGRNALIENTQQLANREALLNEFDNACQDKTRQAVGTAYDEMRGLRADLEKTNLNIVPTKIDGQTVFDNPTDWWKAYGKPHHLLGTLVSILLLSLGAPFWFNALRQLSNLKPAIATKVNAARQDGESQANNTDSQ